ncbi:hypothetical protein LTR91_001243 [Friedmanniomyces endolithicus]|uniref:Sulfite efflux pump SSU1 n=1 Tax=Friedmanniomyces endolithicus TaxID=329885 RepID=A0AAN6FN19_9PEZI|nr:hypothetical protein LTR35_012538 [Friedmanniomyces endolithicus]KAK0283937.1 hypothetical protein LTS00_011601 [Friedmanniomyces endolithicus]KAK0320352.1 hypothetical protein LTR82_008466 [Friedmanniomyces endolithicus]KAK0929727.1 hypothetical protein LTR57_001583 [Friedmanniomyces endolithicus]KAK1013082.1 hypothetical protein LTS01_000895 [Friedmanniomyces endolithicus]
MPDQHVSNGNHMNGDVEQDGAGPESDGNPQSFRVRIAAIIENFSFLWFTLSMNTGILSILMHQLPYQFRGLGVLSTIMFVFNIVLFVTFFTILVLRIILYPKAFRQSVTSDFTECVMMSAPVIAWFTIVAQIGLTVSQATWGGHAWFLVAYVSWWLGTLLAVFAIISKHDLANADSITPALVIPFVATATDALVGALIVSYSHGVTARLAVPVIIVSYMLVGIGLFAAEMVYAVYLVRLLSGGMPPATQSPSLILLVGPLGQSSAALQGLGSAASSYFGSYGKGTFLTASTGSICSTVGVVLGLQFAGMGVFFLAFGAYAVLEGAIKWQHKYSLLWWSTIFPIATLTTAFIEFSIAMDSPAFRVLSAIFLIFLLLVYFVNWAFTLRDIFQGKLLNGSRSDQPASDRVKRQ